MTVLLVIAIAAFIAACVSVAGKCPIWVPVVLLCLYCLVEQLPRG